ncbi:MAG: element excision factor XisH family protein, partial [Cyanobacteria bacterium J06643_4]
PDRDLFLAVPVETYRDFFQMPFIQTSLTRHNVNIIIYDPVQESVEEWIKLRNTDA